VRLVPVLHQNSRSGSPICPLLQDTGHRTNDKDDKWIEDTKQKIKGINSSLIGTEAKFPNLTDLYRERREPVSGQRTLWQHHRKKVTLFESTDQLRSIGDTLDLHNQFVGI
jgi:hypothetical protein